MCRHYRFLNLGVPYRKAETPQVRRMCATRKARASVEVRAPICRHRRSAKRFSAYFTVLYISLCRSPPSFSSKLERRAVPDADRGRRGLRHCYRGSRPTPCRPCQPLSLCSRRSGGLHKWRSDKRGDMRSTVSLVQTFGERGVPQCTGRRVATSLLLPSSSHSPGHATRSTELPGECHVGLGRRV